MSLAAENVCTSKIPISAKFPDILHPNHLGDLNFEPLIYQWANDTYFQFYSQSKTILEYKPNAEKILERRSSCNVLCDMGSGSFGEIMELPKQLLYLRAQLGFMEAREANHAEKTNIHNKM